MMCHSKTEQEPGVHFFDVLCENEEDGSVAFYSTVQGCDARMMGYKKCPDNNSNPSGRTPALLQEKLNNLKQRLAAKG